MLLVATLGALHARHPAYNARTALELARHLLAREAGAGSLVLAGVSSSDWGSGAWRDLDDPLLFALDDDRLPVVALGPQWTWAEQERAQLSEFLGQFDRGRERLRQAARLEAPLREALARPLDAAAAHAPDLLEAVREYHAGLAATLDEGPGTAHRVRRLAELGRALAPAELEGAVVLAPLDDLPALSELPGARLPDAADLVSFRPGEASRARALVDRAYLLEESDDLDALARGLLALDGPPDSPLGRLALEARFAASGLYLAVGDLESARDLLEAVSQGQYDRPAYLPGFVLARLGQVRDLQGERELAVRAYLAALALAWLPAEARRVAEFGLAAPFALDSQTGSA